SSPTVRLRIEVVRGGRSQLHDLEPARGSRLRDVLRGLGYAPEGCAVFRGELPIPLDTVLLEDEVLAVVPTFSGG
ncbi:MAG: hypothetical protein ACREC5_05745, partial [Thermoplasmata archaeon]